MNGLTQRQEQVLNLIRQVVETTGIPPTRAEIAQTLGFRSPNSAEEHVQALSRKGFIEVAAGRSRGIRLVGSAAPVSQIKEQKKPKLVPVPVQPSGPYLELPLIGMVAAGIPMLAQEHVDSTFTFAKALFSAMPDYLLRVRGMSMRDAGILDGDLIAVRKAESARSPQIVIARIGDDVTIKRYRKTGNMVELMPENPDFKPIRILENDFVLEGVAVGLVRAWQ